MSSISLPALSIRPPQPAQDPLENYARLQQLRNQAQLQPLQVQAAQQQVQTGQLENQQRQLQMQDAQTLRQISPDFVKKDADGKVTGYDYQGFFNKAASSGVSPNTLLPLQKSVSEAVLSQLNVSKEQRAAQQAINDQAYQHLEGLKGVTDPAQRQQLWTAATQWAQQNAPTAAQALPQQAPDDKGLAVIEAQLGMHAQVQADANKAAETFKNIQQGNDAQANTQKTQMETQMGGTPGMADSKYRNILMAQRLGRPVSADDAAFKSAYEKQKLLVPTAQVNIQSSLLTDQAKQMAAQNYAQTGQLPAGMRSPAMGAQILNQAAQSGPVDVAGNRMRYASETKALENFTSGNYSQQLNSINTAREHMKTFTSLADALDNGNVQSINKIGNSIGMQFGSDKATNFNIAKQAFSAEVAKAFSGAGVTEGDRKEIADKISSASSPAQLRGAASTADSLLAGKQKALSQTFRDSQGGKPNFGDQGSQPNNNDPFAQFGGRAH